MVLLLLPCCEDQPTVFTESIRCSHFFGIGSHSFSEPKDKPHSVGNKIVFSTIFPLLGENLPILFAPSVIAAGLLAGPGIPH